MAKVSDNVDLITSMATIPNAKTSDWGVGAWGLFAFCSMSRSSGAIHRQVSPGADVDVSVQLRLATLRNPKPLRRAQPDLSTRICSCDGDGKGGGIVNRTIGTYSSQISVNNLEGV